MSLNDKYDDEYKCVDCKDYYCESKWGGDCPAKQRELDQNERDFRGYSTQHRVPQSVHK